VVEERGDPRIGERLVAVAEPIVTCAQGGPVRTGDEPLAVVNVAQQLAVECDWAGYYR
jgi:hypothetical protein